MNRYGTDCVAPFGAWVVFVVVTTGLHPWLQHAVPLGLLPPNGGTASTLLKKMSASPRKKRSLNLGNTEHSCARPTLGIPQSDLKNQPIIQRLAASGQCVQGNASFAESKATLLGSL